MEVRSRKAESMKEKGEGIKKKEEAKEEHVCPDSFGDLERDFVTLCKTLIESTADESNSTGKSVLKRKLGNSFSKAIFMRILCFKSFTEKSVCYSSQKVPMMTRS